MNIEVGRLMVRNHSSIREAMAQMDEGGVGLLLLVDDHSRFVRTVTDGDLRRLILKGASLEDPLTNLPRLQSKTVTPGTSAQDAIEIMDAGGIDHLPVLDASGAIVELLLRKDISSPILLSTPHVGEFEIEYVQEAFRTNWIAPLGPNVDAFERELSQKIGVEHAAAMSSGTAAIHIGLRLLGVERGDLVLCSSLTFVASASPILYQGAIPSFIDSEPDTWNMSPRALSAALRSYASMNRLPKAVIVVNLYGHSADYDALETVCAEYGVPILEDAAESLGATYKGKMSGNFGRMAAFSFNGNKIITTSGGGMLVSNDEALIKRARFLSTQARDPAPHYEHSEVGYNYRMSNVLAGIGRGQLRVLDRRIEARRAIFERYRAALVEVPGLSWMPEASFGRSNRWLTALTVQAPLSPREIIDQLSASNIEARAIWKPMHRQPLFSGTDYFPHDEGRSISDEIFGAGICLPSGSNMTAEQQERVIAAFRKAAGAITSVRY